MNEHPYRVKRENIENSRAWAQRHRQVDEVSLEQRPRIRLQARLTKLRANGEAPAQRQTGNEGQQEIKQRSPQEQLRARVFQQDIKAAALATQRAFAGPQAPKTSAAPLRDHLVNMNRDLSLDSLIVKILGRIWEPTIPAKALRDLVVSLPTAVHAERAAHETKVAELEKKIGGGGGSKKIIDSDAQKEIHSLKSINGSLRYDIKKLEQSRGQEVGTGLQNEINKLKSFHGILKSDIGKLEETIKQSLTTNLQHPALQEIRKLRSISSGVEADTWRLEQAAKDGNAESYRVKTCNYGIATTNTGK